MKRYWLELPDLPVWNANKRGHYSERAATVKAWREAVAWKVKADWKPVPRLDPVEVELLMIPCNRIRSDADNLAGVLKPCIDGLRDAGVLVEDHAKHVRAVTCRISEPDVSLSAHRWVLSVWELPADDVAA